MHLVLCHVMSPKCVYGLSFCCISSIKVLRFYGALLNITLMSLTTPPRLSPTHETYFHGLRRGTSTYLDRLTRRKIGSDKSTLKEQTAVDFRSVKCNLPVPASKEQCLHAAEAVRLAFDGILEDYRLKLDPVKKLLERVEALSLPLLREVRTDYSS